MNSEAALNDYKDAAGINPKEKESIGNAIKRLAKLSPLEYDTVRAKEANSLGVRVATLDVAVCKARGTEKQSQEEMFLSIEPWPEEVDGGNLLDEIRSTIKRFITSTEEVIIAATLWIVLTWLVGSVEILPIAAITAPEKRCGKTTLLAIFGRLVKRPLVASNISSAATFRTIEAHSPTLLVDEADTFLKDNEELRGVMNSGHSRETAFVIRTVGENFEPKRFSTFCPKAISGIGSLPATMMDRAIELKLRRKLPTEKIERLRHAAPGIFEELCSKLARFADDSAPAIKGARPTLPDALNDRAQDNWEPLLAIADIAGGEWPEKARKTALKMSGGEHETFTTSSELLKDIKEVFKKKAVDKLSTIDLLSALTSDTLKPWATYYRDKPMTPTQLAGKLRGYGIHPKNLKVGSGNVVNKGYVLADFSDAFTRYLAADTPENTATPLPDDNPTENIDDSGSGKGSVADVAENETNEVSIVV